MSRFSEVEKIIAVAEGNSVRLGICVNFGEQKFYEYRAEENFDTACSIMAFILLEYANQLFAGKISGKEFLIYTEDNFATGAGTIKFLPFGSRIRMADAVELMAVNSDHIAANLLIDALGLENINTTIQRHGFFDTKLHRKFLIPKVKNMGTSSPKDYAKFLTLMEKNLLLSIEASQFMKSILLKQKYKDILAEKLFALPEFLDVASKSGKADGKIYDEFTDSYIVDGGIVMTTKGAYEIALFAEIKYNSPLSLNKVKAFMQDISLNFFSMFLVER